MLMIFCSIDSPNAGSVILEIILVCKSCLYFCSWMNFCIDMSSWVLKAISYVDFVIELVLFSNAA